MNTQELNTNSDANISLSLMSSYVSTVKELAICRWKAKNFSWENLKSHKIEGSIYKDLQEYWLGGRTKNDLLALKEICEWEGVEYHIAHIPSISVNYNSQHNQIVDTKIEGLSKSERLRAINSIIEYRISLEEKQFYMNGCWISDVEYIKKIFSNLNNAEQSSAKGYSYIKFDDCFFESFVDFSECVVPSKSSFLRATFLSECNFNKSRFRYDATFSSAFFLGSVFCIDSEFDSYIQFDNCKFIEAIDFSGSTFRRAATFQSSLFSGNTNFSGGTFFDEENGHSAKNHPSHIVNFEGCTFLENANFSQRKFPIKTNFSNLIAIGTVDFSHCKFKSQLIVKNSLFFSDFICFGDSANEQLLSGNQTIQIEKDQNGHLYTGVIRESDSQQIEDFQTINQFNCAGSIYYENFDISNRNFKSKAVFDYATFYGVANFHGSTLHDGTTFYNTDFRKAIRRNIFSNNSKVNFWKIGRDIFNRIAHTTSDPKLSINYQGINALPAKLKSHLRLLKIRKLKYIKISSKQEYDDMSAASHRLVDAILSFTLYKKFIGLKRFMKSSYFSKLESCFRKLKKEMGDNERLNSKHMFYVLEVMSRRRRPDAPPFDRLVAVIYGILSGYGEKILTPLVITFILLPVTFSTIYWAIFETRFSLSESMLSYDNLKFLTESYKSNFTTYANIAFGKIYPAGIFDTSADFEKSLKLDVKSVRYFFFKCLGTMESIIGIGTTFLAGIALKRKFNLGS